jgi:hypothetical protein
MQGRTRPRQDVGFAASSALASRLALAFAFALAVAAAMPASANAQTADSAATDTAVVAPFKIHGVATGTTVLALEADPKNAMVGLMTGRLTLRFQPDFSLWTEGVLGISGPSGVICQGGYRPCPEGEFGRRVYRAFYIGMETRLAGLRIERGRKLLFGAGFGAMSVRHADTGGTLSHGSVQASLAYEFPLTRKVGARLATVGYFSESPNAHKAMNGIWEIVGLQGGITFGN